MTHASEREQQTLSGTASGESRGTGGRIFGMVAVTNITLVGVVMLLGGAGILALHGFARDNDTCTPLPAASRCAARAARSWPKASISAMTCPRGSSGTVRVRAESTDTSPVLWSSSAPEPGRHQLPRPRGSRAGDRLQRREPHLRRASGRGPERAAQLAGLLGCKQARLRASSAPWSRGCVEGAAELDDCAAWTPTPGAGYVDADIGAKSAGCYLGRARPDARRIGDHDRRGSLVVISLTAGRAATAPGSATARPPPATS